MSAVAHPPDLTVYAVPAFVALVVAELVVLRRRKRRLDGRDFWASIAMGAVSLLTINLLMGLAGWWFATLLWQHRAFDLGTSWAGWAVALVGWDLIYYWDHRLSHEVRFFWASHVNHHSSQQYNLSTALRQPWTAFQTALMVATLALVGVRPDLIVLSGAINLLYQFWIHTEVVGRLGPLEWVLNTPSHHRVHHGSNARYLDRNYGGILIVWDRLFGSFQAEDEVVVYGLTKDIETYNLWTIAFHEWAALGRDVRRAHGLDRLRHLVRGPGWQPAAGAAPTPVDAATA
ncbi:sterol desaturase family protein [Aquihabitans sp. G128]|uniref:sterol desaturase family protein n=1 Tax=Aquihabitans sp. G128 TaxID=2849779 RepID=UPI001C210D53|nr:sterol desaturase family protein [Aquihabitans sp. G128]QXC63158.1 sterol desaturase family protein [Aquihabitans sp. G128]